MGILIDSDLHMVFQCDACGDVIQALDDGIYAVSSDGKATVLHAAPAGPCQEKWMDTHTGAGTVIYHLPVVIARLASSYGTEWTRYSTWKGEEA